MSKCVVAFVCCCVVYYVDGRTGVIVLLSIRVMHNIHLGSLHSLSRNSATWFQRSTLSPLLLSVAKARLKGPALCDRGAKPVLELQDNNAPRSPGGERSTNYDLVRFRDRKQVTMASITSMGVVGTTIFRPRVVAQPNKWCIQPLAHRHCKLVTSNARLFCSSRPRTGHVRAAPAAEEVEEEYDENMEPCYPATVQCDNTSHPEYTEFTIEVTTSCAHCAHHMSKQH